MAVRTAVNHFALFAEQVRKMIRLFKTIKTFLRGDAGTSLEFLNSVERMRGILDRERMRADRGNTMFTLVTFTCPEKVEMECLVALGQIAIDRVRTTDDVGLLGPHCLGVVLPETSAGGAWRVADDICSKLPTQWPRPQCDVYVHPAGASLRRTTTKARASIAATGGPIAAAGS